MSDIPKEIIVYVYEDELPFFESRGKVWRVSDHMQEGVEPTKYIRADIAELEAELETYRAIRAESDGVVGYHLNGNVATWDELMGETNE